MIDTWDASPESRETYKAHAKHALKWLDKNGLKKDSLLSYKRFLAKSTLSPSSQRMKIMILRRLLMDLNKDGPKFDVSVKNIKTDTRHKVTGHARDEVKRLLEYVSKAESREQIFSKTMIYILAMSGIRQDSARHIRLKDLDFGNLTIEIREKQHNDLRKITVPPIVMEAIKDHLRVFKCKDYLFTLNGKVIERQALYQRIKAVFKVLGIDKSPHALRHSYITEMADKFDIIDAARIAGVTVQTAVKYADDRYAKERTEKANNLISEIYKI